MSASIRTKSINQRELRAQGIAVQMISCSSHWEKSPGGGEILSGWLLTLPWLHPHSEQYLRFSLLNKTIVIDCTLMDARSLQQHWLDCWLSNIAPVLTRELLLCSVGFYSTCLHYRELLPQNTHRRYHWYAGNVWVRRRFFFVKLWKYKCSFFGVGNYKSSKLPC